MLRLLFLIRTRSFEENVFQLSDVWDTYSWCISIYIDIDRHYTCRKVFLFLLHSSYLCQNVSSIRFCDITQRWSLLTEQKPHLRLIHQCAVQSETDLVFYIVFSTQYSVLHLWWPLSGILLQHSIILTTVVLYKYCWCYKLISVVLCANIMPYNSI